MVERTLPKPDTRVRFPSAAPQAPDLMVWGFIYWRVEAVCSLLLQGTRPRFASDTLMSRRNIPASPLLSSPPSLWCEVGCGYAVRGLTAGDSAWEECAGTGRGNTGVRYRRQLAGRRRLVAGYGGGSVGTSVRPPRAHRDRACCSPMRARSTAIPS